MKIRTDTPGEVRIRRPSGGQNKIPESRSFRFRSLRAAIGLRQRGRGGFRCVCRGALMPNGCSFIQPLGQARYSRLVEQPLDLSAQGNPAIMQRARILIGAVFPPENAPFRARRAFHRPDHCAQRNVFRGTRQLHSPPRATKGAHQACRRQPLEDFRQVSLGDSRLRSDLMNRSQLPGGLPGKEEGGTDGQFGSMAKEHRREPLSRIIDLMFRYSVFVKTFSHQAKPGKNMEAAVPGSSST